MPQNFTALLLNLDRDTGRRTHMERELAQVGIIHTRQSGILGDAVPEALRGFFYTSDGLPKTGMKRGELGCYASHLLAMTSIADGAMGPVVLIMEDDLALAPDLITTLDEALRALPPKWDIVRLCCPARRAYVPIARLSTHRLLVRYSRIPNSAGAYLITPQGARKFLQHGVRGLTFDDDLRRPWFHGMESYGILPPPVEAGRLKSTIDSIEAGRFDKGMSSRQERFRRGDHRHTFRRVAFMIRDLGLKNWLLCSAINLVDMLAKPILKKTIIHKAAAVWARFL